MNNLQFIIKDNSRYAMHVAVELCEQGDFDSVTEAFRWLMQERDDAATLGNSKSTADAIAELRKTVREAFSGESVSMLVEGHAIMRAIDAVEAATLGSGTCEFSPTTDNPPTCSNCGWQADAHDCDWLDGGAYEYDGRFCKNCGALVRKAVER